MFVCRSRMSSQMTSSTPRKSKVGPSDICRICASSLGIRLGNLGKTSYRSAENIFQSFYTVWHSSTTMSVTQFFTGESLFCNIFWNSALKMSSAIFPKQASISLRQSAGARQNDGRNPKLLNLFYLFQHLHICISFAVT